MNRRQVILSTGTAVAAGLAGCLGGGGDGGNDGPEAVVESFYEETSDLDPDADAQEILDATDGFLHSESPIRAALAFIVFAGGDDNASDERGELASIETETREENIGVEDIEAEFVGQFGSVEQEVLEAVAEENAVVEAELSVDGGEDRTETHLVTTEDGNWVVFT